MEEWRDIKGYEGIYQVSSYGRIKALNYKRTGKEGILKPFTKKGGYKLIKLSKNNIKHHFSIHRLVAIHFIDNPKELPEVNHKDENPSNNKVENLEWCDHTYNMNYGTKNKRCSETLKGKYIKSKNPNAKKVKCITTGETFNSLLEASEKYDIYYESIILCCRGKRKSAGRHPVTNKKMIWEYYDS